jgi:hypothetical protein
MIMQAWKIWLRIAISAVFFGAISSVSIAQEAGGAAVQLQPYTAADQSASAGVPPGWQVTKGEESVIVMTGPQGETIFLGSAAIALNGPFQPGRRGGGVDLSMPYGANLAQKFTMLLQHNAVVGGTPPPQIKITSATPLQVPPVLGQCGRIIANVTGSKGPMTVGSLFCSLPLDSGGTYKNFFKLAQVPVGTAEQERATVRAVFASYRVPLPMLQRKLAPFTQPPVVLAGPGYAPAIPDSTGAECFDLVVIRETPSYDLPRKCGGHAPD